jgi:hypothetical protein
MCSKDKFLSNLNQINKLAEELINKIEQSRLTINQFCLDLTRDVDIATETRIEKVSKKQKSIDELNNVRRKLLKEINDYEAECVASVEATKSKLLESVEETTKWTQLMRRVINYDKFKVELNEKADSYLCHLKHLLLQLKAFQFGGKQMRFVESGKHIGSLDILKLRIPELIESHFEAPSSFCLILVLAV